MSFFARRVNGIFMFATLFATLFGAAVSAKDMEKPGVVVDVIGDIPDNEKMVLGKYLLAALINSGNCVSAESADAFRAAVIKEEAQHGDGAVGKGRVCELSRQFNIRYLCVASVTRAFDFFEVSTYIFDAETEEVIFNAKAQSPLKTIEDHTRASNKIVEDMFGVQNNSEPESIQRATQTAGNDGVAPTVSNEPYNAAVYTPNDAVSNRTANNDLVFKKNHVYALAGLGGTGASLLVARYTTNKYAIGGAGLGGILIVCLGADLLRLAIIKSRNTDSQNSALKAAEHLRIGASFDGKSIYAGLCFNQ